MSDLRNKLIRLAHDNPELRPDLLPLLAEKQARSYPRSHFSGLADKLEGTVMDSVSRKIIPPREAKGLLDVIHSYLDRLTSPF